MDARVPRAQDAHERPADFENMDVFDVGRDDPPIPGAASHFVNRS